MNREIIVWKKTVTRPLSPLKASSLMEGLDKGLKDIVGVSLKNHLLEPAGDKHTWYVDENEWSALVKTISEKSQNLQYLEDQIGESYRICEILKNTTEKIRNLPHHKLSNEEIKLLLEKYHKSLYEYPFIAWGLLILDQILVNRLKEKLKTVLSQKKEEEKFSEYFEILTTKVDWIDAEKEEIELLMIKSRSQNIGKKELNEELEKHAQKYGWLPMYDHNISPWGRAHFESKMKDLPENASEEINRRTKEIEQRKKKIENILYYLGDDELSQIVHILQKYIILRTYRTDILRIAYYNIDPLLLVIGKRMGLKDREIAYLTINEIFEFLEHNKIVSREEIKQRMKHYLILKIGNSLKIISKKEDIKEVLKEQLGELESIDLLKGDGVYPGIVKGRVKIVEGIKDKDKIQEGDILVATMTTPEMHDIIEKASAIVTDEGGITCHAAVVSRELKIPCVIATGMATKVLKDGDLVEVNSKEGAIRRLKNEE